MCWSMRDPTGSIRFVSPGTGRRARTRGVDRGAALDALRRKEQSGLSIFATFLFTHNAQIAIFAFALGFAFCLPTAFLVLTNG